MKELQQIYEKAGLFYLGKDLDPADLSATEDLTLIKNRNFTTHAAIIGMTGSGKTGLGIALIEEAAMDNIPAIVIDPKGDMGNLLLVDPEFRPESFEPWVREEAMAKGEDPREYAVKTAKTWKDGTASWGQPPERAAKCRDIPKTIYTPGSTTGIPIDLMSSLQSPGPEIMTDSDSFSSYLTTTVSGILSLIEIEAAPLESKEYILLSQIIARSWRKGIPLTIEGLITSIIQPGFKKIGVLPINRFYPEEQRFQLANRFNSVVASPSFMSWLQGHPLDIQKLLYGDDGRPRIAIFSISHLNDSERMFFVTLLLNRYIAWMRSKSGASGLRTLLYMDEIYGYFPPVKNPPSKGPMLTLLKQARAYGTGIVLSTQNPVDLDYRGLSNIGTWFIGRLQTKQDIERVIHGLADKEDSKAQRLKRTTLISNLKKRTFFLKSAHMDQARLFTTRWVMSFLKGPLRGEEISALMAGQKAVRLQDAGTASELADESQEAISSLNDTALDEYMEMPVLDRSIEQRYEPDPTGQNHFYPALAATATVKFHNSSKGIDLEKKRFLILDIPGTNRYAWDCAEETEEDPLDFPSAAPQKALYRQVPEWVAEDKALRKNKKALKEQLYTEERLELFRCRKLRIESLPEESEADFTVRIDHALRELREEKIDALAERYEKKEQRLLDQLAKARAAVEREKAEQASSLLSAGVSILGALFGRKSASRIGTAVNRGGRVLKERQDVGRALDRVQRIEEKLQELEAELEEKIEEISYRYSPDNYPVERFTIKPKKADIQCNEMVLLWRPEF